MKMTDRFPIENLQEPLPRLIIKPLEPRCEARAQWCTRGNASHAVPNRQFGGVGRVLEKAAVGDPKTIEEVPERICPWRARCPESLPDTLYA